MTLAEAAKLYAQEFEARLAIIEEIRDLERRLRNANRYVANALLKVRGEVSVLEQRRRKRSPRDPHRAREAKEKA